jgi:3'-5' exoribonuclease
MTPIKSLSGLESGSRFLVHLLSRLISDLQPQEQIDQIFRAADKQLRANRQGGKYILLRLTDRSGVLTGMMWNADDSTFESFEKTDYIRCRGRLQLYNGALQMIVTEIIRAKATEVDPADFARFDADQADTLLQRLQELFATIQDPDLHALAEAFLADQAFMERFKQAAAAVSNHHAYPGGLLQHTIDLMEMARWLGPRYPQIDTDLLVMGAFLHDLGKVEELSGGDETTYTDRGQLVGHIVIGVQLLGEKIDSISTTPQTPFPALLRWKLEHLILSHHGQLEFGSPKVPLTLEAILLHHIDNLDAKLASATSIIQTDVASDGNWTNYNPTLGRKLWKPTK